jgi:LDH2 family malate/lactate/ureidoglycolate dehydrogenase
MALLDGDNGLGQVVAARAMERAIALAERSGVGLVGVRNSTHFSMAACYAMMALNRDMIGLVVNSGRALMAPWGGTKALISDNPTAVAVPAGEERPVVLDMALSVVARGKIKEALRRGESIPPDWATDRSGRPTTEPAEALAGLLSPIGGPKGYGLALINGLLAGVLMDGTFAWQVGSAYDDLDRPQRVGHLLAAIDVSSFMPVAEFRARVDELIQEIRRCRTAPGVERVYLPGEIEFECQEERSREGIPLSEALWEELCEMAQDAT